MFSGLSITRQFVLISCLGVLLAIGGMAISLARGYDQAVADRQAEVQRITEVGAAIAASFAAQAQSGEISVAEAQTRALHALGAVRYDGKNYIFVLNDDGVLLAHPNKKLLGTNVMGLRDPYGTLVFQPMVEAAQAGRTLFHPYYFPKSPGAAPEPKISYAVALPQWQWVIGTGLYVDDLNAALAASAMRLAEIFIPLLAAFVALSAVMCAALARLLRALAGNMNQLALGDVAVEIAGGGRRDEIGQMVRALGTLRNAAAEAQRLESEAAALRAAADAERQRAEAERAGQTASLGLVVTSLSTGLAALAQGDLTRRLTTAFADLYEPVRHNFNASMDVLERTMQSIHAATETVRTGAGEINQASDDLARRTEQQAASLEQTAAALDEITATVQRTAAGARQAHDVVAGTKTDAARSGAVVDQAVAAMGAIEDSARQISNIISVIDEIAFQTNLLALNAGVEAARAGDAGRGFAVVASEVRALAQRSADAAKEIKTLISASGTQVATGVALVAETGKALSRTLEQVEQIARLVSEIAVSAQEQATGLSEVNTAMNQMDQVTQQNAAMVEQATAASHGLAGEASALAALVAHFRASAAPPPARQPARRHALATS